MKKPVDKRTENEKHLSSRLQDNYDRMEMLKEAYKLLQKSLSLYVKSTDFDEPFLD